MTYERKSIVAVAVIMVAVIAAVSVWAWNMREL